MVYDGFAESNLLELAGIVESRSGHPLAAAIVRKAKESQFYSSLPIEDFQEVAGLGVSAVVKGQRYLIGNQRLQSTNGVSMGQYQDTIDS